MDIQKSIFITNTFAGAFPDTHISLWSQFEKQVSQTTRNAFYGAENVEYVKFIKTVDNPDVKEFFAQHLIGMQSN